MKARVAPEFKDSGKGLQDEKIKPKKHLLPILQRLSERKPAPLQYLGTSFGVTKELFQFWKKNAFVPIYLRQAANELTGEHTCVMIRPINLNDETIQQPIATLKQSKDKVMDATNFGETTWVSSYFVDFKRRMLNLLGYDFRHLSCALAFQFIGHRNPNQGQAGEAQENTELIKSIDKDELAELVSPFDLKRLD